MANEVNENTKILNEISDELKKNNKQTEEIKKDVNSTNDIAVADERLEFQKEAQTDLQLSLMKEQNSLLTMLVEKFEDISTDKPKKEKGLKLGFLSKFLPKSFLNLFAPVFKTLFSKKGLLGIGKKLIKFVGAPIAALFAGIDFFKGWNETEGNVAEKIQAAMSSVLSGLTLGLVDSDVINEGFHKVNDFIFNNVTIPVMDFLLNFPERISEMFSSVFNMENFNNLMNVPIINDIVTNVKDAFDNVKQKIFDNIINPIQNFITYAVKSFEEITSKIQDFGSNIKEIALAPLDTAKDFFEETKNKYEDFKDKFSFKNLFESDEEKMARKEIETKTIETLNKTGDVKTDTTNNNILTNNSNTVVNEGFDMSVRSDDLVNAQSGYFF